MQNRRHFQVVPFLPHYDWMPNMDAQKFFPTLQDANLIVTTQGEYSISKPAEAMRILHGIGRQMQQQHMLLPSIIDGTANNGGDTIHFVLSNLFSRVVSVEKDKKEFLALKHNVREFSKQHVQTFEKHSAIRAEFMRFIRKSVHWSDIVYLDPPWGGRRYKKHKKMNLFLAGRPLSAAVSDLFRRTPVKIVAVKVPFNFDFDLFMENLHGECVVKRLYISKSIRLLLIRRAKQNDIIELEEALMFCPTEKTSTLDASRIMQSLTLIFKKWFVR